MLRLMLADDEQYERNYLEKVIKENYPNLLEIVCKAADGVEALEKLEECRPQIALLDIKMPRLNGLKAAEEIRRRYPDMQLVIISAYSDFSYARQAIKLGVTDYLLKPYLDSELRETLDKVIAKAGEQEDPMFESPFSNPAEDSSTFDYYRDLAKDLLWNAFFRRRTMSGLKKELAMWGTGGDWLKVVLVSSPALVSMGSFSQEVLKNYFHMEDVTVLSSIWMDQLAVCLFSDRQDAFTELTGCIKRVRGYLAEDSHVAVSCGVSGAYSGFESLAEAYDEAASFIRDYSSPATREQFCKSTDVMKKICELEDKIIFSLANQDPRKVEYYLALLVEQAEQGLEDRKISVKLNVGRSFMTVIRGVNQIPDIRISTSEAIALFGKLGQWNGDGESLKDYMEDFISLMCRSQKSESTPNTNMLLVQKAKDYIRSHYKEAINLQSVAEELGVSFGYLSKCFRNAEPQSFSEYLTSYRLNEAKRMLQESHMSITDVAYEIGFSDANYFGKCFKKREGMSPKEYISMIQLRKGDTE